jgi:Arc/MetJ-type ribon-helix-helix transcriptional regulator
MGNGDMSEMRKITVEVSRQDLENAQALTGQGVSDTVRTALRKLAAARAQQQLRKLRGKVKFTLSLNELRYDRE